MDTYDPIAALEWAAGGQENLRQAYEGAQNSDGTLNNATRERIHAVPASFDSAGLAAGMVIETPDAGDLILDAWIDVDTAWDGTTPKADIGFFQSGAAGIFAHGSAAVDLTQADATYDNLVTNAGNAAVLRNVKAVPARVVVAAPLLLVVSQNGLLGGAAVGATHGHLTAYIRLATPDPYGRH